MKRSAILIYELQQIHPLVDFLSLVSKEEKVTLTVIALGADIEFLLKKRGIPFQSGRDLRRTPHFECLTYAEKVGREVLNDPTFSFFSYRNVSLVNVFMTVLQDYLQSVLYFADVITTLADKYPHFTRLILFSHTYIPLETDGVMAPLEANAAVDAARIVGKKYNLEIFIPKFETRATLLRVRIHIALYYMKRRLFGMVLSVLNRVITVGVSKKEIRILASDNWKNISSLVRELPDAELFLLDRAESRKAGWRAIWRNRMRFIRVQSFAEGIKRREAQAQVCDFVGRLEKVRSENVALREAEFLGHSLTPILSAAVCNLLERGGERAINLIDGAYSLCKQIRPDVVLVRASYSAQIHFPILCYVARALGIPSLEVQHGLIYLGMRSGSQSAVEYIATYGPLTSAGFKKLGYTDETLFDVGSPRFDAYQAIHDKKSSLSGGGRPFTIACIVPAVLPQSWSDSYEVMEYLSDLASAVSPIPNVLVLLKLRPDPHNEAFYRSAIAHIFSSVSYRIAQYEPLVDVFAESDAIVTIYSTTVLEALISGRPTIYNGTLEFHRALGKDLSVYADAGALLKADTRGELVQALGSLAREPERREALVKKADIFMKQNYSFDGNASKKLADVIRVLAIKKSETFQSGAVL